jgi:predicted dehydrogenase
MSNQHEASVSRRDFVKTAAAASIAATFPGSFNVFAQGSDTFRVGVIGCGGRGTGAAIDCLKADPGVEIVALGDLVGDRVDSALARLTKEFPNRVKVPANRRFTGFDNYKGVLSVPDVNLIVTAAPPGFRPIHFKAAVEAGKHVFMEKPVAVDPVGVRSVIATAELAAQKKLAVVAGTQRRHQKRYLELMKRIQDGQIGDIVAAQVYWNQGDLWVKARTPEMSEIEWQCRNWLYFSWLSGDHIVEQHVHNIDVANWAMGVMPKNVMGMGGR